MVLFITGGSRGIGRNVVLGALAQGYDVAFTYKSNEKEAEETLRQAKTILSTGKCLTYKLYQSLTLTVQKQFFMELGCSPRSN